MCDRFALHLLILLIWGKTVEWSTDPCAVHLCYRFHLGSLQAELTLSQNSTSLSFDVVCPSLVHYDTANPKSTQLLSKNVFCCRCQNTRTNVGKRRTCIGICQLANKISMPTDVLHKVHLVAFHSLNLGQKSSLNSLCSTTNGSFKGAGST